MSDEQDINLADWEIEENDDIVIVDNVSRADLSGSAMLHMDRVRVLDPLEGWWRQPFRGTTILRAEGAVYSFIDALLFIRGQQATGLILVFESEKVPYTAVTVADLINYLQNMPQELPVSFYDGQARAMHWYDLNIETHTENLVPAFNWPIVVPHKAKLLIGSRVRVDS